MRYGPVSSRSNASANHGLRPPATTRPLTSWLRRETRPYPRS